MIRKGLAELKARGLRAVLTAVFRRLIPRRFSSYRRYKPFFQDRIGLEIGGSSGMFERRGYLPIYTLAARVDNCNFGHRTIWEGAIEEGATFRFNKRRAPGNQYIAEATDLGHIEPASYDFVLSSHTLEHIANPLKALSEWIRILKDEGVLVLVVPHKDGTFDHRRPVTSLQHLIQDFENHVTEADLTHLNEIIELHDLAQDPEAGALQAFKQRSQRNLENRCLHHHVFDTRLAVEVVHYMGLKILDVAAFHPFNILIIAQKPARASQFLNDRFRDLNTTPCWHSPFPSDQPALPKKV